MTWVAIAVGVGGAGISTIAGNVGARKQADRQVKQQGRMAGDILNQYGNATGKETAAMNGTLGQFSNLSDLFGQQASKSYLDTTEGMAFSSMLDERSRKNKDRLANDMNNMGGTQEAYLAGLGQINEAEGSATRDLVAGADQRRNQLRGMQMQSLSQLLNGQSNMLSQKNNQVNSAYGRAGNIFNGVNANSMAMMNGMNQGFQQSAPGIADYFAGKKQG